MSPSKTNLRCTAVGHFLLLLPWVWDACWSAPSSCWRSRTSLISRVCLTDHITYVTFGYFACFHLGEHFFKSFTRLHTYKPITLIQLKAQLNVVQPIVVPCELVFCLGEATIEIVQFSFSARVRVGWVSGNTSHEDNTRRVKHRITTLMFMMAAGEGRGDDKSHIESDTGLAFSIPICLSGVWVML